MDAGDWIALGALVLSACAIGVSLKARGDGKEAARAATRSAKAAEDSFALQQQDFNARRAAEAEASRPRVDLRIEHVRGTRYRLVNHGAAPAVNLSFVEPPEHANGLTEVITLAKDEGHDFNVLGAMGLPVPTFLRVVWDGQTDPVTVRMPAT